VSFRRVVFGESILTNRPPPPLQPSTIAGTPSDETPKLVSILSAASDPVDDAKLLQPRECLRNRLTAKTRSPLQGTVRGVQSAGLVVKEVENQTVKHKEDVAAD
jgi:hypothetical protein